MLKKLFNDNSTFLTFICDRFELKEISISFISSWLIKRKLWLFFAAEVQKSSLFAVWVLSLNFGHKSRKFILVEKSLGPITVDYPRKFITWINFEEAITWKKTFISCFFLSLKNVKFFKKKPFGTANCNSFAILSDRRYSSTYFYLWPLPDLYNLESHNLFSPTYETIPADASIVQPPLSLEGSLCVRITKAK